MVYKLKFLGQSYICGDFECVHGEIVEVDKKKKDQLLNDYPEQWELVKKIDYSDYKKINADLVFVNYNTLDLLKDVLESVKITDGKYNIIVIDNNSTDGSSEYLSSCKGIKKVLLKENLGYGGGCNVGASISNSEIIVFMNTDLIFNDKNWLNGIKRALVDKKNAIAGPRLIQESGENWDIHNANWVCGACFGVRRDFFEKVQGFDQQYFMYFEETDMCKQAVVRGLNVINNHETVIHLYDKSPKEYEDQSNWFRNSKILFENRWEQNRNIGMMIIGNEMKKWIFDESIEQLLKLSDFSVILVDKVSDGTDDYLRAKYGKNRRLKLVFEGESRFLQSENTMREKLWQLVINENPNWVISLDADELFSDKSMMNIQSFLESDKEAYMFKCLHFWKTKDYFRVDNGWDKQHIMRMARYLPDVCQDFFKSPQHCGSFPRYYYENKFSDKVMLLNDMAIKHYGFMTDDEIQKKGEFYRQFQANPYNTILNSDIKLKKYSSDLWI